MPELPKSKDPSLPRTGGRQKAEALKKRGAEFIGPDQGMLSCGYEGIGRLWPVEKICQKIFTGRGFVAAVCGDTPTCQAQWYRATFLGLSCTGRFRIRPAGSLALRGSASAFGPPASPCPSVK